MNLTYIENLIKEKSVCTSGTQTESNNTYFNIIFLTIQICILILQLGMIL